jgi:hypothetical protein
MNRFGAALVTLACGLATSLAAGVTLAYLEARWGISLYTWILWFIIPVGAIAAGAIGAAGYYWGARATRVRPGWLTVTSTLLVSVATFFVIHYAQYLWLEVNGVRVSRVLTFPAYLDRAIRATSLRTSFRGMEIRSGSIERLDTAGYVYAGLEVIGFALGGLAVFALTRAEPHCESCQRLLARTWSHVASAADYGALMTLVERVRERLDRHDVQGAMAEHTAIPSRSRGGHVSRLHLRSCESCTLQWVEVSDPSPHTFQTYVDPGSTR